MKKLLFTSLTCLALLGCAKDDCIDQNKINEEALCTMEYLPVCGCNGQTYGNECNALNAGLISWTEGECE